MAKKLLRFENCRILKNGKILENDYLLVRDGKIINYMDVFFDEERSPDIRIDCKGALLSPGLIDIQVNGWCFSKKLKNFVSMTVPLVNIVCILQVDSV